MHSPANQRNIGPKLDREGSWRHSQPSRKANRLRTGEWAAYRMSGTSSRSLALIQLIEQFAIAGCLVLATALASVALTPSLIAPAATLLIGVASGALWMMIATLIGIDLPFRKPTDLAKDR